MLYHLLPWLSQYSDIFNLFRYITFRSFGAMMTAFFFSLWLYPTFLAWLKQKQKNHSNIRADVPKKHLKKSGTPTMGGAMIIFATLFSLLFWGNGEDSIIWGAVVVFVGFGLVGMVDDLQKWQKKNKLLGRGLPAWLRLVLEGVIALFGFYFITRANGADVTTLYFPFLKNLALPLGVFFLLVVFLVIVGAANATNLTDGLDGLAIGPILVVAGVFGIIAYLVGNAIYADYLQIRFVNGTGELSVLCAAIIGAGLGFLWYNAPPAMIFMGDTGSLALGGVLGYMAIATHHEIVLAIAGFLFVLETLSVMLQVGYFKYSKMKYKTGRRLLLMAPLHHHYEQKGLAETHIVIRFWIVSAICALLALATLKLR